MSYEMYSEKGYVGRLATVEGWGDILNVAEKYKLSRLAEFGEHGFSKHPKALHSELAEFLGGKPQPCDLITCESLKHLMSLLVSIEEIAIIHG